MFEEFLFNLCHWCFDYREYKKQYFLISLLMERHIERKAFNLLELARFKEWVADFFGGGKVPEFTAKGVLRDFYHYYKPKWNVQEVRTSGNSGKPFRFWVDCDTLANRFALVDYRFKQIGYERGQSFVKFWYPTTGHGSTQLIKERLWRKINGEHFISYFDMVSGKKKMIDYVNFIKKHKPVLIEGYAGGLVALSNYILENRIRMPKVKYIVTGAGMVTPEQHNLIETAFNGKHYDRYGSSEFGEIAHQLPGISYYDPNPFLEIFVKTEGEPLLKLDQAKDGDYEIFITDPRNYATPFWRYKIGDVVSVKDGKIISIKGRTEEVVRLPNGEYLPTGFFYQFFKDSKNVNQWQIVYNPKKKRMLVRVSPRILEDELKKKFKDKYFKDVSIEYKLGNFEDFETVGSRKKIKEIIIE